MAAIWRRTRDRAQECRQALRRHHRALRHQRCHRRGYGGRRWSAPSGGGKSTLLRCINLLEIPSSGTLLLGGESLTFRPGHRPGWPAIQSIRRQTGMVFQNFQLFPHRTAIENVMEGPLTVLKWPKDKRGNGPANCSTKSAYRKRPTLGQRRCRAANNNASHRPGTRHVAARLALRRADLRPRS